MKHFEIGQWADVVRGLMTEAKQAELSAHLASGCRTCRRTVDVLTEVARLAAGESRNEVPAYAVQSARAIFALQQLDKVYFFPRVVGQLVYDSFKEPLPAGLRARHRISRHALYQAGDYSMDLRMEHQRGTANVTLVGQIVNRVQPDKPMAILPVFLVSGKEILAHACSNAFGEFQLEYAPKRRLRLYIQGNQGLQRHIEVPLSRFAVDEFARKAPHRKSSKKNSPEH